MSGFIFSLADISCSSMILEFCIVLAFDVILNPLEFPIPETERKVIRKMADLVRTHFEV